METRRHKEPRAALFIKFSVLSAFVFNIVVSGAESYSKLDEYSFQHATIKPAIRSAAEYQLNLYGENIPTKNWLVGTFFSSFVAAYDQGNRTAQS